MKYKIVEFNNGLYAIKYRYGWSHSYKYVDLKEPVEYWYESPHIHKHCLGTLKKVKEVYNIISGKGVKAVMTPKKAFLEQK